MNKTIYKISRKIKILPLKTLLNITKQKLLLPFYHTVSEIAPIHIKHLYKIKTPEKFEEDLEFLLKHYEPVDYKMLIEYINNGKIKENIFLLTFDDGLREFYDIIAPVLIKKGIPAVCFLNSDFIDNKDIFFRFKTSILINELQTRTYSPSKLKVINNWFASNGYDFNNKCNSLLSVNYNKKYLLDEFADILEIDFGNYLKNEKPYLNTGQIRELIKKGFHFGAHSADHPQYSDINEKEQIIQTEKSINKIKDKFNLDYKLFSFPFSDYNVSKDFFDKIFDKERPIADLTFGTAGLKRDSIKLNLQRIPMEIDNFTAKDIIYGEYNYYILKSLLNKNIIKRI